MDITKYINSEAISQYLKEIEYKFTPAEIAWIIFEDKTLSVAKKHEEWKKLMICTNNVNLCDDGLKYSDSKVRDLDLFSFLQAYIKAEDKLISEFYNNENAVYDFMYYSKEDENWITDDGIYSSIQKILDYSKGLNTSQLSIKKHMVDNPEYKIVIRMSSDGTALELGWYEKPNFSFESDIQNGFYDMWFDLPLPFKKGDILMYMPCYTEDSYSNGPFIYQYSSFDYFKGHLGNFGKDSSDMLIGGLYIDDEGNIYSDCADEILNYDYYVEPLKEKDVGYKIWLDDLRTPPKGYIWCKSVKECEKMLSLLESAHINISEIDMDHDLGDYASDGGDGIRLLDWLIERETFYPIKLHSMNPVGMENMKRTIKRYWPKDI